MHKFNRLLNDPFFKNNPERRALNLDAHLPGRPPECFQRSILIPNFCPFENIPTTFKYIVNTGISYVNGTNHFGVVFKCPSCQRYCIIDYLIDGLNKSRVQPYNYNFIHPSVSLSANDFRILSKIAPHFKSIYVQSAEAEKCQLNTIYPMGYRKALEFLVDGYLMKVRHKSEHTVTNNRLGENINATKDADLINTAKVAAWVGNDDTHLKTRNPQLDITMLKDSLNAFSHFVINKWISKKDSAYIKKHSNSK